LSIADDADGLVEQGGAGYISPRNMVAAQSVLAEHAGASIFRGAARSVRAIDGGVEVELASGALVKAERALVSAGAFTDLCGLSPVDLGLTVYGRTTVLVRINAEAMDALELMPTMIDAAIGAYILPPIRYPDGHLYLKIGVGTPMDATFTTLDGLQTWFKGDGSPKDRAQFTAHIKGLIPVLETCDAWHTDTCAVTRTRSGLPIIDYVLDKRIAVAVGGNGKGAKGSDEWGRIAADLIAGRPWSSEVLRDKLALSATELCA